MYHTFQIKLNVWIYLIPLISIFIYLLYQKVLDNKDKCFYIIIIISWLVNMIGPLINIIHNNPIILLLASSEWDWIIMIYFSSDDGLALSMRPKINTAQILYISKYILFYHTFIGKIDIIMDKYWPYWDHYYYPNVPGFLLLFPHYYYDSASINIPNINTE